MHFNQRSVNKLLVHVKATWKPELLISESLISFPPHHDPLPALFFLLELKTLSAGSLQGCRMLSRLWSSLALSLIIYLLWMAVSAERLRGKDTNSAAGMPRAGRTNRRVACFLSLLCSLCSRSPGHRSAASRFSSHVLVYCSITLRFTTCPLL